MQASDQLDFLVMSDIHLNIRKDKPMQIMPKGYHSSNDLDAKTYQSFMQQVNQHVKLTHIKKPNFILLLGDLVGHKMRNIYMDRQQFVHENQSAVYKILMREFPKTPIISVFGNNDSFEKNYGRFTYQGNNMYQVIKGVGFKNGLLSTGKVCDKTRIYPCLDVDKINETDGYGVVKIAPKLEILALNSVMFSVEHSLRSKEDVAKIQRQLAFVKMVLEIAKAKQNKVIIAMHIPVGLNIYDGKDFWHKNEAKEFMNLLNRYESVIAGVLVGHTHMEELKTLKLKHRLLGEYFTAGLSTSHGNLPSVKTFHLINTNKTWRIEDYTSYAFSQASNRVITPNSSVLYLNTVYSFKSKFCKDAAGDINQCLDSMNFHQLLPLVTLHNPNYPHYRYKCFDCFNYG